TSDLPNVEVAELHGMLVQYVADRHAQVILKGLRAVSDLEFEYAMALMNRRLEPRVDTLFLMTSDEFSYLSSSLVKEVARLGGSLDGLVPGAVAAALKRKYHDGAAPSPDAQVAEKS